MKEPLAKSDGTFLLCHTRHVVEAMEAMMSGFLPTLSPAERLICRHGAILHDLGKAHPYFQKMVTVGTDRRDEEMEVPHRHEISSLLFLPLFAREEWEILVDLVVAHHKPIRKSFKDKKGRGFEDLVDEYDFEGVIERHLANWEKWSYSVRPVLEAFGVSWRPISQAEATDALEFVACHLRQKRLGRNRWRGLLMAADHLASALQEDTNQRVDQLFQIPNLSIFEQRASNSNSALYPLSKYDAHSLKHHTLVIAPTGSGKTDYLLRRCRGGRVFYMLPFQASINAMYLRLKSLLKESTPDIRRVHAASRITLDADPSGEEQDLQRHPGASIKVMTPHQAAALVFGLAGHEAIALDLAGQHVILDEVHVYGEQSQAMVLELIEILVRLGAHVHLGSATVPTALLLELRQRLGGTEAVHEVRLSHQELISYDRHIVLRLADEQAAHKYIREAIERGERVLFIANRVAAAQERAAWARNAFPGLSVLLVHSRYRRIDRAALEGEIAQYDKADGPCLVCATQVIEVSLDISFDTMVTDCAPFDGLIQRFGRVNRRRTSDHSLKTVAVIAPPGSANAAKPYDLALLKRSWDALPESGDILEEISLQGRIDSVYPNLDLTSIEAHLVEPDGVFRMRELTNYRRSELLEVLEIDSAVVVRESDREAYQELRGDERQELEIPISWKALRPKFKKWFHLDQVGNAPFICPDECYSETIGLMMDEQEEPICIIL